MLPRPAGVAALAAAFLATAGASAAENKTIDSTESLGGDYTFDTFTVASGGTLQVQHLSSDGTTGGRLHVKANTIKIFAGGTIVADGAGYPGVEGMAGGAAMPAGGGAAGAMPGAPGGGGGLFANGANGTTGSMACLDVAGSSGGQSIFDMTAKLPLLGSAGGAANVSGAPTTKGGAGGGVIILEAAVVQIDGTITANGNSTNAANGVSPGAGSGGSIQIITAVLQGGGTIQAKGGDGAHGKGVNAMLPNNGGGGSGGVLVLKLPSGGMLPSTLAMNLSLLGGGTGDCGTKAADGMVVYDPLPGACVDVDGDGEPSSQCGGMDCDDTDPDIHPGATEECDGKDNDCNQKTDEGTLCSPGNVCIAGTCQANPDAGQTDAGPEDGGAKPDHIEFRGGCAVPPVGGLAEGAAAASVFALGTILLGASRRRRRR